MISLLKIFFGITKNGGGPKVKTGPNRGKIRTRNTNGRWRAKRSDAGKSRGR